MLVDLMLATQPEEITVCLLYVPHNLEAKQKISVILGLGIQYLVASCTTEHFLLELMGPLRGYPDSITRSMIDIRTAETHFLT